MEEMSEGALEVELEEHLTENRASLQAVHHALSADAANSDLVLVREELLMAVKGAEESLFQLKRARLLREVDVMVQQSNQQSELQPAEAASRTSPLNSEADPECALQLFQAGTKCRFWHTDGRWYNGRIIRLEAGSVARVSFLTPTSEKLQVVQMECRRADTTCNDSADLVAAAVYHMWGHTGVEVQVPALRPFKPPDWEHIPLGSAVLADPGNGLWRAAELEAWDKAHHRASVVFTADGMRLDVAPDALVSTEHASASDVSSSSEDDGEDLTEESVEDHQANSGSLFGAVSGIQTESVTFAHWEKHTRGVASKMMARMGFFEGMGLGKGGQGITEPVKVQVISSKQSLEYASEKHGGDQGGPGKHNQTGKKKSRGGKRKREKKWAAAQRAAKSSSEGVDGAPNVFDFINQQLAAQPDQSLKSSRLEGGESNSGRHVSLKGGSDKTNRRTLVAHEHEIKELRTKMGKLQEMAARNCKEKSVYDAVSRKLAEAHKALAAAEAAHASTTHAVHSKEKERKWLRF